MSLFSAIEATWRSKLPKRGTKHTKERNKLERELRKLECSVSYGRDKEHRGRYGSKNIVSK